ncbi:hypothetical protein B0H13DRAFT_1634263 [Mycena leptocephala]|nr:hypothetical protein B0H13DRAFT_1634263 [Mycena leptocephala]
MRRTSVTLAISLGKTMAQITAQFAPVPGLVPAAELICCIIDLCQNLTQNRYVNAAVQLRDRCHRLGLVLYDKAVANEIIGAAVESVTQCLTLISAQMNVWAQTNRIQGFIQQSEIAQDIERCHRMLADCLTSFHLTSHVEIHDWQAQFGLNTQQDHRELVEYLVNLDALQVRLQIFRPPRRI